MPLQSDKLLIRNNPIPKPSKAAGSDSNFFVNSDLLPAYQKAIIRWLFCMRGLPRVFIRIRAWLFAVDPSGPVD